MTSTNLLSTGIPGLDEILGGGIATGSLVIFAGAPGVGKTVVASQTVFAAARAGMPVLILTAFSESHVKLLEHLRAFTFFDGALLGDSVSILSLNSVLGDSIDSLANDVAAAVRKSGAQIVLIDGFQGLGSVRNSDDVLRSVLRTLATQISFTGTTVLLTLAGDVHDVGLYPQFTIADTIVGLELQRQGRQHKRLIEVTKQRGHAPLSGQHSFEIGSEGALIYPRIEAYPIPADRPRPAGRAPFGLPELDELMNGGPTAGTTTILAGASGTGRTSLALRWALEDASPDAQSVYVTFSEHIGELEQKAGTLHFDLAAAVAGGAVHVLRFSPNELDPDKVGSHLLPFLTSARVRRLVIDDINILLDELGPRARDFLAALDDHLYGEAITGMLVFEIEPFREFQINLSNTAIGLFDENVVVVQKYQVGGSVYRVLAVLHMRYSMHDRTLREFAIDEQGIHVFSLSQTQAGPLTVAIGNVAPPAPEQHIAP